jgi:hypothetical protein
LNLLSIYVCSWTLSSPATNPLSLWRHDKILLTGWLSLAACPLLPVALLDLAVGTEWSLILWGSAWSKLLLGRTWLQVAGLHLWRSRLHTRIGPCNLVRNHVMREVYQRWTLHIRDVKLPLHFRWSLLLIRLVASSLAHLIHGVVCWGIISCRCVHHLYWTSAIQVILLLLKIECQLLCLCSTSLTNLSCKLNTKSRIKRILVVIFLASDCCWVPSWLLCRLDLPSAPWTFMSLGHLLLYNVGD